MNCLLIKHLATLLSRVLCDKENVLFFGVQKFVIQEIENVVNEISAKMASYD